MSRVSGSKARRMRMRGLIRKEAIQILRDPSSIAIAFLLPLVLLLIFGYGISLDARNVPVAIVVEAPTPQTASFVGAFEQSPYFEPRELRHRQDADKLLVGGEVDAIVVLRSDFSRRYRDPNGSPIQVIVNGTDANTARLITGYIEGAWVTWLTQVAKAQGLPLSMPVALQSRVWFNEAVSSRNYLVPGLIAIVMTLIGALLTALVIAREWERGTMEALLVTPVSTSEILLGKLVPYFVLGMGGMALSVAMAIVLFDVPFEGSFIVLGIVSALFLLTALGMGLLISTISKNQFVAGQVAIIVTFLPALILSGFIFDIASMPVAVQWITHAIAARYFVTVLQTIFLAGNVWTVIIPNALALAVMAVFFLGLTWRKTPKKLD